MKNNYGLYGDIAVLIFLFFFTFNMSLVAFGAEEPSPTDPLGELSADEQALVAKERIDLPDVEKPEVIYQLKKIDPNRIGAETAYETFAGVRIPEKILESPAIGVGHSVE
ncbi:MAG: hypothetical protein NC933_03095, partial [Candidatus Omnitrophica bacterium]|nr:hypothetical protein [Candidatus Omnitrophota bacterium]